MRSAAPARTRSNSPMRTHGSGGSLCGYACGRMRGRLDTHLGAGTASADARSEAPDPCRHAALSAVQHSPSRTRNARSTSCCAACSMLLAVACATACGTTQRWPPARADALARQREGCEARGRQAVRQTRDSGPRSQGPPRPTKQEINHLHLGGCFRNALLLLSVLHTLVNAMKPGNPRATSSAALRAASRSWGTGERFCIGRCRRSCTVRPGRGRTRNRPLARSNDNLLVAGCHFKAKIGLVHDRPPLRALRTMLITAEGRVVHQLDESYTSFLTWHPKWSWCCQAREGPLRDSRVRRRAGVAAPMGTTRSDGATAMKREAGESTAKSLTLHTSPIRNGCLRPARCSLRHPSRFPRQGSMPAVPRRASDRASLEVASPPCGPP